MALETIAFNRDSLKLDKVSFKLLVIINVLADNKLAYRGTLKDIAVNLGYSAKSDYRTNTKIKEAITTLEAYNYIKTIKDGNTYTLTLSKIAEKSKIIKIQRKWIDTITQTLIKAKKGLDWSYAIKVLLFLLDKDNYKNNEEKLFNYAQIAEAIAANKTQVQRAMKILEDEFSVLRKKGKYFVEGSEDEPFFHRLGTIIELYAWMNGPRDKGKEV